MNRRLRILYHWLSGKKEHTTLIELLKFLFSKTYIPFAISKISQIEQIQDFYKVSLKETNDIIYFPSSVEFNQIYMVISEAFYPSNWHYYEIEETKVLKNDVVVDCGAAEGLFSLLVANRCQKVYAVEPLPSFIEAMKLTLAKFNNVEIISSALSNEPSKGIINDNGFYSSFNDSGKGYQVDVTTMDNLFYEQGIEVNYIKADLEGFEIKMLEGAYNTIKFNNPKIAITTYHKAEHAELISKYLKDINPDYNIKLKGIEHVNGAPIMLHAWI